MSIEIDANYIRFAYDNLRVNLGWGAYKVGETENGFTVVAVGTRAYLRIVWGTGGRVSVDISSNDKNCLTECIYILDKTDGLMRFLDELYRKLIKCRKEYVKKTEFFGVIC